MKSSLTTFIILLSCYSSYSQTPIVYSFNSNAGLRRLIDGVGGGKVG